jgi:hypothetical protein
VFGAVVGILVLAAWGSNRIEYSSPGWREFMSMNSARGSLHGTPRLNYRNVTDSELRRIGWTRNDQNLFRDFMYPDTKVYSGDAIRALAKMSPYVRDDTIGPGELFNVFFRVGVDRGTRSDKGVVCTPLLLVAVALALWRRPRTAWLTLLTVVWFFGVLIALFLYVRLPGRVLTPLEGVATFIAIALPAYLGPPAPRAREPRSPAFVAVTVIVSLAVAAPLIDGLHSISRISGDTRHNMGVYDAAYAHLRAVDSQGIFAGRGDLFSNWAEPLSTHTSFRDLHVLPLGWATNSPAFSARLERQGITDVYTALQTNRHMYVLGPPWKATAIRNFYREHRGINVRVVQVGRVRYPSPVGRTGIWLVLSMPTR